jgi:hypothetical protein
MEIWNGLWAPIGLLDAEQPFIEAMCNVTTSTFSIWGFGLIITGAEHFESQQSPTDNPIYFTLDRIPAGPELRIVLRLARTYTDKS